MTISLISPDVYKNIVYISCGSSSPKLSGSIDVSGLYNLETLRCINNSITGCFGYGEITTLNELTLNSNRIKGEIERLDNKTLDILNLQSNEFTGRIPLLPNTLLKAYFNNNRNLSGELPSLSSLLSLQEFSVSNCSLSGTVPSLSSCGKLTLFNVSNQLGANKLNGSIGNLEYNTRLNYVLIQRNQFNSWQGLVPASLNYFLANNNNFSSNDVDSILIAFASLNTNNGILNVGGTGNQSPTSTGLTAKTQLISRGWTVTTN